jgi:hypothetical protein
MIWGAYYILKCLCWLLCNQQKMSEVPDKHTEASASLPKQLAPFSDTLPQAGRSPSSIAKCFASTEASGFVNVSATMSSVGQ